MITDLLSTDGFIIYNKKLARIIGTNPAILLGHLCSEYNFYSNNGQLDNGMFFCTREKIKYNTGLTETEQRTATKKLKDLGIIESELRGMPSKTYYRINESTILSILSSDESLQQDLRNPYTNNNINNNLKQNTKDNIKKNSKKDFSKLVIDTCLKNDIEDDKSIELIESFLTDMKIKTPRAVEANIAKLAGKPYSIISKCINTSFSRNYRYITPPEWLQNNSYNGNGKCSKELAWRTHEEMEEAEKKRQEFFDAVERNDPSIHHF